jgi:hypothetical protein
MRPDDAGAEKWLMGAALWFIVQGP